MTRAWFGAVALVATLAAPRPIRLRTIMSYIQFGEPYRTQAMAAFKRGLYKDSLIVPFSQSDSLASASRRTVLVRGSLEMDGSRAKVCFMLVDVLARPITEPDTATVQLAELDSVVAAYGARFARVLAQERWPSSLSTARCK